MNDALLLRFKTDNTVVSKGFSASYIAVESMVTSVEYTSQIDEDDDVDLAFRKNKKRKKSSAIKAAVDAGDDEEDEDEDDDNDEEGMLAKSP